MIKIFYNSEQADLIFAIAAIMKQNPNTPLAIVPIDPLVLLEEQRIDDAIKVQVAAKCEAEEEDYFLIDQDSSPDKLYLLDIGPVNQREAIACLEFFDRHESEIVLWLDSHLWPDGEMQVINKHKLVIHSYAYGESCAKVMREIGYKVPLRWVKAAEAMANMENLEKDNLAMEYYQALAVAQVYSHNTGSDYRTMTFQSAIDELVHSRSHDMIDHFIGCFPKMIKDTEAAQGKFVAHASLFHRAFKKNRPVGYLRLRKESQFINIQELALRGLENYPWLCVIDCKLEGRDRILFYSHKVLDLFNIVQDKEYLGSCRNKRDWINVMDAEIARSEESTEPPGPD